jgi:hypothetical protein
MLLCLLASFPPAGHMPAHVCNQQRPHDRGQAWLLVCWWRWALAHAHMWRVLVVLGVVARCRTGVLPLPALWRITTLTVVVHAGVHRVVQLLLSPQVLDTAYHVLSVDGENVGRCRCTGGGGGGAHAARCGWAHACMSRRVLALQAWRDTEASALTAVV